MSKGSGLGKAIQNKLQRNQRAAMGNKAPIFYQETQKNDAQLKKQKMRSVLQQNSLTQFLQTAQLSQQNFKANRDIKFRQIRQQVKHKKVVMIDNKAVLIQDDIDQSKLKGLQMPRRPNWKQIQNKQQLSKYQADAYLNWRRNLAALQQSNNDIKITPYQKNIEVWKQLWRVTDRADLMIQIVDGRDPLFFRSQDLVQYIHQVNTEKKSLLLINKSDLVPNQIRIRWNKYLNQHKINHIFFSAKLADKALQQQQQQQQDNISEQTKQSQKINNQTQIIQHHFNKSDIVSVKQLIQLLNQYVTVFKKEKIQVGLVGYPNVGKSSVINALLGKKKVGVASMPGKTKHFQTLILNEKVTLCDCPGLVFPRISASHSYMVLNGLFPLDTIKVYSEPMRILAQRIPKKIMQETYALHWKQNQLYDADTILNKWATLKGYFTGNGLPNQSVAAKNILKDYVNGVIVYVRNPPGIQGEEISQTKLANLQAKDKQNKQEKQKVQTIQKKQEIQADNVPDMKKKQINVEKDLDVQFFKDKKNKLPQQLDFISQLTEDDLLDIMEGKKLPGIKVTKQMRANIKHALKRGEKLQEIKKKYFGVVSNDPKKLMTV